MNSAPAARCAGAAGRLAAWLLAASGLAAGLTANGAAAAAPADAAARAVRPAIEVLAAVAPAAPPGAPTMAVYLQLRNRGALADALLSASTPLAGEAMIHAQQMDGGIMRMRMLERFAIPAGGTVAMRPGGIHVMLAGLVHMPKAGEQFPLLLRFERAGDLPVQVRVLPPGSAP